jgi:hypothetical protein
MNDHIERVSQPGMEAIDDEAPSFERKLARHAFKIFSL